MLANQFTTSARLFANEVYADTRLLPVSDQTTMQLIADRVTQFAKIKSERQSLNQKENKTEKFRAQEHLEAIGIYIV
jgi:hypothetical protein